MRRPLSIRWTFISFLLLCLIRPPAVFGADVVGELTRADGRVDITSPGEAARPAAAGDSVAESDIIRTKSDGRAEITFADGSVIRVAPGSRIEISDYPVGDADGKRSVGLFRGKIQNVIRGATTSLFGRSRIPAYEVRTPTMICGVRGTDFFTYYQRGVSGAIFREGSGYGYNIRFPDRQLTVAAGQALLVRGFDAMPTLRPVSAVELDRHLSDTAPGGGDSGKGGEPGDGPDGGPADGDGPVTRQDRGGGPHTRMADRARGRLAAGPGDEVTEGLREYTHLIDLGSPDPVPPSDLNRLAANETGWIGITPAGQGDDALIPFETAEAVDPAVKGVVWELYAGNTPGEITAASGDPGTVYTSPVVREEARYPNQDWGTVRTYYAGTFTPPTEGPGGGWSVDLAYREGNSVRFDHIDGTDWSEGEVAGRSASAWVSWTELVTGVGGGELAGAYQPETGTWAAEGTGAFMTTGRFIEMAESRPDDLKALGIPFVEIGRTDLAGTAGDLSVTLDNVTFFSFSAGGDPALWATPTVQGTFAAVPAAGTAVPLTGGDLSARFQFQTVKDGGWGAGVTDGTGVLQRSDIDGASTPIQFQGGAAGTYDPAAGTLSGTAAGTAGPAR